MLIQLWHEGAVRKELSSSSPSLSPSGLIQAGVPNGRAATAEELDELKAAYVHGALAAQSIGASGVEVHAAHGYFLDLFLWEETNQRSDGYGGSDIRQRVRYPAEIVSAIREEVGEDFVISFRFSQWKEVDFDAAIVDTPEELSVMLDVLCGAGVDVFHASTRRILDAEWPERSALGLAGWTKKLSRMPVIAVGSVGLDTDLMDNLFGKEAIPTGEAGLSSVARKLEDGEFDLVSVGRAVIGDADWVKKVHQGRWAEMRPFCKDDMMQEWEMGFVLDAHQ